MSFTVPIPPPGAPRAHGPDATPNPGVAPLSARAALAARLDALLPQTQCTRCGYADCHAYADALAAGEADLNQCPPGGADGVRRLADALQRPALPLSPTHGEEGPRRLVFIDESACIGCTLCIQACPVDAIIGAPKRMHVVDELRCTGCELCVPACPVDCIAIEDATPADITGWDAWSPAQADDARARYTRRQVRLARDEREHAQRLAARVAARQANAARAAAQVSETSAPAVDIAATAGTKTIPSIPDTVSAAQPPAPAVDPKRTAVEAALARARLRAKMRLS